MALYLFFLYNKIGLKFSSPLLLVVAGQHRFVFSNLLLTSLSMMSGLCYSQLLPPPIAVNRSLFFVTPLCYIHMLHIPLMELLCIRMCFLSPVAEILLIAKAVSDFPYHQQPVPCRLPEMKLAHNKLVKLY